MYISKWTTIFCELREALPKALYFYKAWRYSMIYKVNDVMTIIRVLLTSSKNPNKTCCSEVQIMSPLFDFFLIYRSFVIQQIPSSNLFMVVVDNECFCDSVPPITMAPIEIRYILLFAKLSEIFKYWQISYYVKLALHDLRTYHNPF